VIDDAEFPYISLFRRDGYAIDKWNDIQDLTKLESGDYDIILLDIQGVGLEESENQGLGVLEHLKKVSPAQIIVAYSNADYALELKRFFDLADATLDKRSDYVDFKQEIDRMLVRRFSLEHYVDTITHAATRSGVELDELPERAREAILQQRPKELRKYLERHDVDGATVQTLLSLAQAAMSMLQILSAL
jgi:CheY-like chemotaxis protein